MVDKTGPNKEFADPYLFHSARARIRRHNDINTVHDMRLLVGSHAADCWLQIDLAEDTTKATIQRAMDTSAENFAMALLGRDEDPVTIPFWNDPDGVAAFVKEQINSPETQPKAIIKQAFIRMLGECWDLLMKDEAGETVKWDRDFEATVRRYVMLFLGMPFVEQSKRQAEAEYQLNEQLRKNRSTPTKPS
jgi:hypothetical protein